MHNDSVPRHGAKIRSPVSSSPLRTGLYYDRGMTSHRTLIRGDEHPEDPGRIVAIFNALCTQGMMEDTTHVQNGMDAISGVFSKIKAMEARMDEVCRVHSESHWRFLKSTNNLDYHSLKKMSTEKDSIYYKEKTFCYASLACGGAIDTCRAVMTGSVRNALAVIRPPGHHAEPSKTGLFIFHHHAADFSLIMILRDVHHGNGTQKAFYEDPSVLYISIHRHDDGKFYPDGHSGDFNFCRKDAGHGVNVNVPWPDGVSAGFDAAAGDTLGECHMTPAGYAHMTQLLMELVEGKVVVCLEGGYNLKSISNCAVAVTKVLMGETPGILDDEVASQIAVEVVDKCVLQQTRYWPCLKLLKMLPADQGPKKISHFYGNTYVDWAVKAGFGVIDANIPTPLAKNEVSKNRELCTLIWDNCLRMTDATKIIFIGVGEAFRGLLHLLSYHDSKRVRGCLSLIGDKNVRAISRNCVNSHSHEWYYSNSLALVNKGHQVLSRENLSKRFGKIVESSAEDLEGVLKTSSEDVKGWITERIR
ncbi:Histone deacetylase hda1 [Rhizina undulata]